MVEIYGIQRHVWAWAIGGVFAALATIVGLWTVRQHLKYNPSHVAKYEIRILLMVPVYAVEAWLGLYQKEYTLYWDVLRESYEALVIYSFYTFLVTYLGGEEALERILAEKEVLKSKAKTHPDINPHFKNKNNYDSLSPQPPTGDYGMDRPEKTKPQVPEDELEAMKEALHAGEHFSPCHYCMRPYILSGEFQRSMRAGILQYVPIKVFTAIATFVLQYYGKYEGGHFALTVGYPYIAFITNASQIWAMYCLVLFYHALYDRIKEIKPLAKFLSIKLVVFFTFWQSVAIAFFVELEFLHETQDYTNDQVAGGVQDFIICIEMFIAAIAHVWIFPYDEFPQTGAAQVAQFRRIASVLSPHDLAVDMHKHMLKPVAHGIHSRGKQVKTSVFGICCTIEPDQSGDEKATTTTTTTVVSQVIENDPTLSNSADDSKTTVTTAITIQTTTSSADDLLIDSPTTQQQISLRENLLTNEKE